MLIAGTFTLSVLLYVDRICISTAKSRIAHDLALDDRQMGWVLSIFALGYALFQTPGGWLADHWGPRRVLPAIVVFWSAFTGLTAAAFNLPSMLATRFLFGAGEAGAFPGMARAIYSWIPMGERGFLQGINFSGSRVGGAASLVTIPLLIEAIGWQRSFLVLMAAGFAWALWWYAWFRDDPAAHPGIERGELDYILAQRQEAVLPTAGSNAEPLDAADAPPARLALGTLLGSRNLWLISLQYFASNFTFFFCLSWLYPHLQSRYQLSSAGAGLYSAAPFLAGALGNWTAGWLVDFIFRGGNWVGSRRTPALIGFALSALGLLMSADAETAESAIAWLSLAVFGADMTISPSWSFCIDIGKRHAGVVSGTMNMAGNLGSFLTALAFPYLTQWTGSTDPFFYVAAGLNVLALPAWLWADPRTGLERAA